MTTVAVVTADVGKHLTGCGNLSSLVVPKLSLSPPAVDIPCMSSTYEDVKTGFVFSVVLNVFASLFLANT